MERFALDTLDAQDRAFVESMASISERLETLKLVFPDRAAALAALQLANERLTAAALLIR
jgi:hypothetical protein